MNEKQLIEWIIKYLNSIFNFCDDKTKKSIKTFCHKLENSIDE
jgi:hypothetical protein